MRLDYPGEDDVLAAKEDGRDVAQLGGDIMIHGGAASIGCVAIGDPAIEEIFWLVASVGLERTSVVIAPSQRPLVHLRADSPSWLRARYERLTARLSDLPK